ncbi:histidinol-phosphate transaminase [Cecembia sp.]|uniref:pyridoxal phosphate-dependent aminotransferase n=1 Tax=Cecembia sp. TaxID=1898110 RepID=UPI0025B9A8E1|nr:histidinol-phosphate transaminase [Cecembia sp.]
MKTINRRSWIKSSLFTLGGIVVAPSIPSLASGKSGFASKSVLSEVLSASPFNESRMLARLNANENPYGPSPKVIQAISESISMGNRYGHRDAFTLIEMIAEKEGVSPEHIMLGPGSSDLLEKIAFVRFMEGGNVVSADPSYMSLIQTAQAMGATWKPVLLTPDHSHDLDAMASAVDGETKLVYVCNPNNPTGSITNSSELKDFCKTVSTKVPVFVDEAYLEFLDNPESHSMVGLVSKGHDVIVARTFSKIHGMAGLRIGYIVAQPDRIKSITTKVRSTMGLCVTSLKGAIASMKDQEFLKNCRTLNAASREFVSREITSLGYDIIPSYTSFMIFPIAMDGPKFLKAMNEKGVGIRVFNIHDKPWCRVSMGTMEEMEIFVDSFKTVTT